MVDINTTNATIKSITQQLQTNPGLPFKDLLPNEIIEQALLDVNYRNRTYPPSMILWCMLSQALDEDQSLQKVVLRVVATKIESQENIPSSNTAAYSQARSRLPVSVLETLFEQVAANATSEILPEWTWRGRFLKLIDGSTLSMPDTPENQLEYPQPKTQKKGIGFPLARFVVIICFITGVVLKIAKGSYTGKETGEHALLRQILDAFNPGDIALADTYYPSFFLIFELMKRGIDFVFPAHAARHCDFRTGIRLGATDHIATWNKPRKPEWMSQEEYDNCPESIQVRETKVSNEHQGFRTITRILVTSFLNPKEVSPKDLSDLYSFRWFVEVDLRSLKTVMHMDVLRSKTPEMIDKEILSRLLAYNLIRQVMIHAATVHSKIPRQLSFKLALRAVEIFRQHGILTIANEFAYNALLTAIASKEVGNRPDRYEPRAIKRRPKPHKRLQKPRGFYKLTITGKAA